MIKRQTFIILAALCMMALFATAASANDIEDATIGIGDGSGYVTIPITVTNATNIGTVDVTLSYDPTVVNVTHVAKGDMGNVFLNLKNATDGWVRIGSFKTGDGLNGAFILANVSFEPVSNSGSCPLEISVNEYVEASPIYNAMPYIVSNGTYTISNEVPSSKSSRDGTYPPESPDEDYRSTGNVTEEGVENETIIPESVAPPVKTLPSSKSADMKDDKSTNWAYAIIVLAAVLGLAYLLYRKRE